MKTILLLLFCLCALHGVTQKITHLEYCIDVDKGYNKNTVIELIPFADSTYKIPIDLSSVTIGTHILYMRTRDSTGKWSITTRRNIEVVQPSAIDKVIAGEYFIDTDPGYGNATAIKVLTKDTDILQTFKPNVKKLQPGFHLLYMRFKDSYGAWGITARRNIEIIPAEDTAKIIAVEYAFDKDPGYSKAVYKSFATPAVDGKFQFQIPYNAVPATAKKLYLRAINASNYYSFTKAINVKVTAALIANSNAIINANAIAIDSSFKAFVSPNPVVSGNAYLHLYSAIPANIAIMLFTNEGKIISAQQQAIPAGNSVQHVNVQAIANGNYFIRVSNGKQQQTMQIIKQ